MAYIIKNYDGSTKLTIGDGLVDRSTSLSLVGKNVSNFGTLQNENFLYLLENFASSSPPVNQVTGQLWYKTDSGSLNFYNSNNWITVPGFTTDTGSTQPGYFYFDTITDQLYITKSDNTYGLIGPEALPGFGTTKLSSTILYDNASNKYAVIEILTNGELVGIISTASFMMSGMAPNGFSPQLNRGITLKNANSNDFALIGTSLYSNLATTATNLGNGDVGSIPYQSSFGNTAYLGIASSGTILVSNGTAPIWTSTSSLSINHASNADNLTGGQQGYIPYQQNAGSTTFLGLGNIGWVLTAGATRPTYTNPGTFSVYSSQYSNTSTTSTYAATVPWGGVTNTPTTIAGYGITDMINQSVLYAITANTATTVVSQIGQNSQTNGTVYGTWVLTTGTTFNATYADLAEKYLPDAEYEPGTVLVFGGEKEVTISTTRVDTAVAGIVSTNPAYTLNDSLEDGVYIALIGRVPCNVIGPIKKGDRLVTSNIPGVATALKNVVLTHPDPGTIIGKAIQDYDNTTDVGVIEVMVRSS